LLERFPKRSQLNFEPANFLQLPSYSHQKTLEPLKNKAPILEWGSRGRKFESSHPDFPEANKIKASGIFYFQNFHRMMR